MRQNEHLRTKFNFPTYEQTKDTPQSGWHTQWRQLIAAYHNSTRPQSVLATPNPPASALDGVAGASHAYAAKTGAKVAQASNVVSIETKRPSIHDPVTLANGAVFAPPLKKFQGDDFRRPDPNDPRTAGSPPDLGPYGRLIY